MKWYQYVLPTYGNWGGPGWSGGAYIDDPKHMNWLVQPIDAVDAAFYRHDWKYQHGYDRRKADIELLEELGVINAYGVRANAYKIGAEVAITLKLLFNT